MKWKVMEMRTNELRKMIISRLEGLKTQLGIRSVFYRIAAADAMYPHVVVDITGINLDDINLKQYTVDIDCIAKNMVDLYTIADGIQESFNALNNPNQSILPTFFLVSRIRVQDTDKSICREIIRLNVQLYDNVAQ